MLLMTARRASCRGRGGARHDTLRRLPDRIAAHGGGLPPDTAPARHNRTPDHPQNDGIDPVAFAAPIWISSRQATGPGRLPFPLSLPSCGNYRRAPAGDRCTLAQAGATGSGNRVFACQEFTVQLCSTGRLRGRRGSETLIVALAEGHGAGRLGGGQVRALPGFRVRPGFRGAPWPVCPSVSWRSEPAPVRFKAAARRGAAGHAVLDKVANRASQVCETCLTARPPRSIWPARTLNRPSAAGSF